MLVWREEELSGPAVAQREICICSLQDGGGENKIQQLWCQQNKAFVPGKAIISQIKFPAGHSVAFLLAAPG